MFLGNCEFPCQNGRCIPNRYVCDNRNNCGDWSDEYRPECKLRPYIKAKWCETPSCGTWRCGKRMSMRNTQGVLRSNYPNKLIKMIFNFFNFFLFFNFLTRAEKTSNEGLGAHLLSMLWFVMEQYTLQRFLCRIGILVIEIKSARISDTSTNKHLTIPF